MRTLEQTEENKMKTLEQYLKDHYKSSSIKSYLARIEDYKRFNPNHLKASLQNILAYIKALRIKEKHPKTIKNYLHSIKIYYQYLIEVGLRQTHPCKGLQLKDKVDKNIKIEELYSKEQLKSYLENSKESKKLIVSFLVYQGLKTSELREIKLSDIDLNKAEIKINNRVLPLQAEQIILIIKYLEKRNKRQIKEELQDYLLINRFGNLYKSSEINASINHKRRDKITPLKIRQSFIKNLLFEKDLRIVQVFAGHKISSTTKNYRTTNLEELRTAIENFHPLK